MSDPTPQNSQKYFVPSPLLAMYKNKGNKTDTMMAEANTSMVVTKIQYGNGINIFCEGATYPKKGFPTPEAVWAANQAKITLRELSKILATPSFIFSFIITLNKHKFLSRLMDSYKFIAEKAVTPYLLTDDNLTPIAYEVKAITHRLFTILNLPDLSEIASFLVDIDTAYRYPLEDVLSTSSKELLINNPRKEIKRLATLLTIRFQTSIDVSSKITRMASLLSLLLLIPKYKRAFINSINTCKFENLQYDQADYYWCLQRSDYLYLGMTYAERQHILTHYSLPTMVKVV